MLTAVQNSGPRVVDQPSFNVWKAHFGQTTGSDSATSANTAVPEPATLVLICVFGGWVVSAAMPSRMEIPNKSLTRDRYR